MAKALRIFLGLALGLLAGTAAAADLISVKRLSMELAGEVARKAVEACRDAGYQVTAVVVDRNATPQAMMRDVLAPRFTIEIAERKANAVILSGVSSADFRRNRADIREEMNQVEGILLLDGGLPIQAAGSVVGAVGVSGAPGGDKDEICARKALDAIQERLDFAE